MWSSLKMWLLLAALLYFAVGGERAQVEAWQARGVFHKEENPGKCTYNDDTIVTPGETMKASDACAEVNCLNEKGEATINGCGAVAPPVGCEWIGLVDQFTSFPKCCAQNMKCVDGMNAERRKELQQIWSMFSADLKVPHGACSKKKQ